MALNFCKNVPDNFKINGYSANTLEIQLSSESKEAPKSLRTAQVLL
jgi:hypothetical protein